MYLNLKAGSYGFDIEIISDNTTIKEDVTFGKLNKEPNDRGFRGWEYQEPNDETTNNVVQLLEDIAYFRHNDIEHTNTLIVRLMEKKSLIEKKNLLEILKRQVEQEEEENGI